MRRVEVEFPEGARLTTEKCGLRVTSPLGMDAEVSAGRLRARATADKRPMASLTNKERGLRAATEVLNGTMSVPIAMESYLFTKKLLAQGFEDKSARQHSTTPPSAGVVTESSKSSTSTYASAWGEYCTAYIYAGQQVKKFGKRRAACMATEKFNVSISPSTALRASRTPGEAPARCGTPTIIPTEIEDKLEMLVLSLREMNMPCFRFMVINYLNVLLKGTKLAGKLEHGEVRAYWYYNWLGRCERLKTSNSRGMCR